MKLIFVDVKKAHVNARCDEAEEVELPDEFKERAKYVNLKRQLYGMTGATSRNRVGVGEVEHVRVVRCQGAWNSQKRKTGLAETWFLVQNSLMDQTRS